MASAYPGVGAVRCGGMSATPGPWRAPTPFTAARIGAVAIYCSDGRYGDQFDEFLHQRLGLPRYDRLAIPGGAAVLANHLTTYREQDALLDQLRFLVEAHGLERVVLIAHQNCVFYIKRLYTAENRLRWQQEEDLARAAEAVRSVSSRLSVASYFAALDGGTVSIEPVAC